MKNFLVLSSSGGSTFQASIEAMQRGDLEMPCLGLMTNLPDAGCVNKAKAANLPIGVLERTEANKRRVDYDRELGAKLQEMGAKTHETVLACMGWMRILGEEFLDEGWQALNVHPALLPKHAGLMDLAVHQSVLDAGDTESGMTIHKLTKVVDGGPIIRQDHCDVIPGEPATDLRARVQQLEKSGYWQVLQDIFMNKLQIPV